MVHERICARPPLPRRAQLGKAEAHALLTCRRIWRGQHGSFSRQHDAKSTFFLLLKNEHLFSILFLFSCSKCLDKSPRLLLVQAINFPCFFSPSFLSEAFSCLIFPLRRSWVDDLKAFLLFQRRLRKTQLSLLCLFATPAGQSF